MASFHRTENGKWRALVARKGKRKSKTFRTKQEAKDWAARQEYVILNKDDVDSKTSFGDMLDRYAREVSTRKKGARWEIIRIEKIRRDKIARIGMGDLTAADFAGWRDRRLLEVKPSSVNREMVLMSSALNVAVKEWGMIRENPMKDVRKPKKPPARERLVTEGEIERMAFVAGDDLNTVTARAFHCFLFAIETGMRAGEIARLRREDINGRVARLHHTKNGHPRDVPLSNEAMRLVETLPTLEPVFGLRVDQIDALFRKVRDKAGVKGLTFHDSRHTAITRLSRKLDVLALAKMVGHKNLNELLTYYDESAESLADRLD